MENQDIKQRTHQQPSVESKATAPTSFSDEGQHILESRTKWQAQTQQL